MRLKYYFLFVLWLCDSNVGAQQIDFYCEVLPEKITNKEEECVLVKIEPMLTNRTMTIKSVNWLKNRSLSSDITITLTVEKIIFHYFPGNLHMKFTSLENISIRNSGLREIRKSDISSYKYLKELILSHNNLTEIEVGLFDDNHHLKKIDLDNNQIQFVDAETLRNLRELSYLSFDGNNCSSSPSKFQEKNLNLKERILNQIAKKCKHLETTTERKMIILAEAVTNTNNHQSSPNSSHIGGKFFEIEEKLRKETLTLKEINDYIKQFEGNQVKQSETISTMNQSLSSHIKEMTKLRDDLFKNCIKPENFNSSVLSLIHAHYDELDKNLTEKLDALLSLDEKSGDRMSRWLKFDPNSDKKINKQINKLKKNISDIYAEINRMKIEFRMYNKFNETSSGSIGFFQNLTDDEKFQILITTNAILIIVIVVSMMYSCIRCLCKIKHPRQIESPYEMSNINQNLQMTTLNDHCQEKTYNNPSLTYDDDPGYDKSQFDDVYEELPNDKAMIINMASNNDEKLDNVVAYDEVINEGELATDYEEVGFNIGGNETAQNEEDILNLPIYAVVNKNK